jgi:hypothetical protein
MKMKFDFRLAVSGLTGYRYKTLSVIEICNTSVVYTINMRKQQSVLIISRNFFVFVSAKSSKNKIELIFS